MGLFYLETGSTDPAYNLAAEQVAFDKLDRRHDYIMLWQNDNAVIVGRYQITAEEINERAVQEQGIRVVRRLSGGGAVYHDLGNLNFTVITDAGRARQLDFTLFCEPVAALLHELGVPAKIDGRNDMTIDGRKFSGNAQYLRRGRVMHHGTILFSSDLAAVERALRAPAGKAASRGVASVRSRVTNVKEHLEQEMTLAQFWHRLRERLFLGREFQQYHFTQGERAEIERLRADRYATWAWNVGTSPTGPLRRRQRFEGCGTVEARLHLVGGRVERLQFSGDFFSGGDPDALARLLAGAPLERESLSRRVTQQVVSQAIHNLTKEQLLDLLLGGWESGV